VSDARVRLLVLDDHEVVRDGIVSMIDDEPDLRVVAQARTAEEALPLYVEHRPDVALVDLRLPGSSGAEFIAAARREHPEGRFVVLTTYDSDEDIYQAFKAGAQAYVLKDSFRAEIMAAIRAVHAGQRIVPESIEQRLAHREAARSLSARELEVLTLVARGESNKTIAAALDISPGTVKTYLLRIFEKLDVDDRTAAATEAMARGLIRP
jgi:two-component system NarL family response regulator